MKSIVPKASSSPKMSVRITGSSLLDSPRMSPMATPATGVLSGTPESSIARQQPQTVAMEEEPQLSVIRLSVRMLYGKSSAEGRHATSALSARLP